MRTGPAATTVQQGGDTDHPRTPALLAGTDKVALEAALQKATVAYSLRADGDADAMLMDSARNDPAV